jgi:DNA polymerase III epsilon subunit-like protein
LHLFYTLPFNIGIQVYKNGELTENHDLYLKWPNYQIRPEIAKFTHYDAAKIEREGIEPKKAFEILKYYLDNPNIYFIGNNLLNYDCMIFKNSPQFVGVDISYQWLNRTYDNNAIFKGYKLGLKPDYDNFLAWQFSMNSIVKKGLKSRLQFACKEFGIEYIEEDAHSAAYDCKKSYQVFTELIKKIDVK